MGEVSAGVQARRAGGGSFWEACVGALAVTWSLGWVTSKGEWEHI